MQADATIDLPQAAPRAASRRERLATRAHQWHLLPMLQTIRGWFRRDLRVLAYHRVRAIDARFVFDPDLVSASPAAFRGQMQLLRDRFHPVSCREVVAALDGGPALPREAVLVTFDDGYDDNHTVAFPILRELGVPATFFVATGHIDSGLPYAYDWLAHLVVGATGDRIRLPALDLDIPLPAGLDERRALVGPILDRLKFLDDDGQQAVIEGLAREAGRPRTQGHADCRPMGWDQLRQMQAAGMEIGGHGVHHRMLAKLPDDALRAEVDGCQARLTAELGAPAIAVSYPVGGPDAYDARVVEAVQAAGFRLGFTYLNGTNPWPARDRYRLLRTAVERGIGDVWFRGIMAAPEVFAHPSVVRVYPA